MKIKIIISSIGAVLASIYYWFWGQASMYHTLKIPLLAPDHRWQAICAIWLTIGILTLLWLSNDDSQGTDIMTANKLRAQNALPPARFLTKKIDGFIIGKTKGGKFVKIPNNPDCRAGLITGSPGCGKSVMLLSWLLWFFSRPDDPVKPQSMLICDIKPELAFKSVNIRRNPRVKLINVAKVGSLYWGFDVFHGLNLESRIDDVIDRVKRITSSIIIPLKGNDKFFSSGARNVLTGIICWGFYQAMTFGEIINLINMTKSQDLITQILSDESVPDVIQSYLIPYDNKSDDDRAFNSIDMEMRECLQVFMTESVQAIFSNRERFISPEVLTNGSASIVIQCPDTKIDDYSPVLRVILTTCFDHILNQEEGTVQDKISAIIDEAAAIKVPDLAHLLSVCRSKRLEPYIIVQSITQLYDVYGAENAETIIENSDFIAVMSCKSTKVAHMIADWIGDYRDARESVTRSGQNRESRSVGSDIRHIFDASDFMKLQQNKEMIVVYEGDIFKCKKLGYYQIPELNALSNRIKQQNSKDKNEGAF